MSDSVTPAPAGQMPALSGVVPALSGAVLALVRRAMAAMSDDPLPEPGSLVGDSRLPLAVRAVVDGVMDEGLQTADLTSLGRLLEAGDSPDAGSLESAAESWLVVRASALWAGAHSASVGGA